MAALEVPSANCTCIVHAPNAHVDTSNFILMYVFYESCAYTLPDV